MWPPKSHWGKSWQSLRFSILILGHEWWSYRRQGIVENCESTGRNGHHFCKCVFPNHYELPAKLCQSLNWMPFFLPVITPYASLLSRGPSSAATPESMDFFCHLCIDIFGMENETSVSVQESSRRTIYQFILSRNKTSSMGSGHLQANLECLRIASLLSHQEARSLKHQGVKMGDNRICSSVTSNWPIPPIRWKSRPDCPGFLYKYHIESIYLFPCVFEALVSFLWHPSMFWIWFHLRHGFLPLLWKLEVKWIHRFCSACC